MFFRPIHMITPSLHNGTRALHFFWKTRVLNLFDLGDYKMRGHGAGSAGKRRDGQGGGIPRGIPNRQHRIDRCGGDDSHANDLRRTRSSARDGIGQVLPVQGQEKLSRLGHADLEQDLIGADGAKIKGGRSETSKVQICQQNSARRQDFFTSSPNLHTTVTIMWYHIN